MIRKLSMVPASKIAKDDVVLCLVGGGRRSPAVAYVRDIENDGQGNLVFQMSSPGTEGHGESNPLTFNPEEMVFASQY